MKYYFIDNFVTSSSIELNSSNGYNRAIELTQEQYEFGLANKHAKLSEILAMELEPVPEPVYTEPEPSLEEIVAANADALDELIQHVYGS